MKIEVTELQKVNLKEGDVLILRVPDESITPLVADSLRQALEDTKVLVVEDDIEIKVVAA